MLFETLDDFFTVAAEAAYSLRLKNGSRAVEVFNLLHGPQKKYINPQYGVDLLEPTGDYNKAARRVQVRPCKNRQEESVLTLFHELAHAMLHWNATWLTLLATSPIIAKEEVEAETVALLVYSRLVGKPEGNLKSYLSFHRERLGEVRYEKTMRESMFEMERAAAAIIKAFEEIASAPQLSQAARYPSAQLAAR